MVGWDKEIGRETERILEGEEQASETEDEWDDAGEIDEEDWEEGGQEIVLGQEWQRPEQESVWNLAGLLRGCHKVNRDALLAAGVTAEQWVGLLLQHAASPKVQKPFNLTVGRLLENPQLRPDTIYAELGRLPPGRLLKLLTPWEMLERGRIGPEYMARMRVEDETPSWKEAMRGMTPARQAELRDSLAGGVAWRE